MPVFSLSLLNQQRLTQHIYFVITDLQTLFQTQILFTVIICLCTTFHSPIYKQQILYIVMA